MQGWLIRFLLPFPLTIMATHESQSIKLLSKLRVAHNEDVINIEWNLPNIWGWHSKNTAHGIGDNIAEGSRKGWCEIAVSNWIWIGTRKYFWHVEGRNIRMLNYWNTSMANWLSNSDLPPWLGRRRRGNNPAIVFPSAELDFVIMHFLCCAKCEFSRLYTLGIGSP